MLAFSHVTLKWDHTTLNFICNIPSHSYVLLRFPCSFMSTLLCLLFSKQGMVRFTLISRSSIQKLNKIGPTIELRGSIHFTFLFLQSFPFTVWRKCVCVNVCVFYYPFWTQAQTQFAQSIDTIHYGREETVYSIREKQHSYIHTKGNEFINVSK